MNSISHRYVLEDLEELAREKTQELEELIGQDLQLQWPPKWDLRDWEIDWFMRAYREYSLFELKPRIGKSTSSWPSGCPHVGYVGPMMLLNKEGKPYVHEFLVSWERPIATPQPRIFHSVLRGRRTRGALRSAGEKTPRGVATRRGGRGG